MASSDQGLLVFEDVTVGYPGEEDVLKEVSLQVHKGEVAGLASLDVGGGKTTLVKVAAGLLQPTSGRVLFDGVDVYSMGYNADQRFRSRFSIIIEGGALMVNRTIWDNVSLPLRYHGELSGRELKLTVERLLAQCGYNERPTAFPWQVSERSRRLAAFARALARNPEFVIVDRFFEGLEMPDWRRLFELVMELNQNEGVTWLLVSELDPAIFQVAERVAILERGRLLGFDFRRRLYGNPRIQAAFEAAEVRLSRRYDKKRLDESERILIVDSGEEMDLLGASASDPALDTATPGSSPLPNDLAETINIDGQMGEPVFKTQERRALPPIDPLEMAAPPQSSPGTDPEQTISLDLPKRDPEQTITLEVPHPGLLEGEEED